MLLHNFCLLSDGLTRLSGLQIPRGGGIVEGGGVETLFGRIPFEQHLCDEGASLRGCSHITSAAGGGGGG